MIEFPLTSSFDPFGGPPRCLGCGYILAGLDEPRCPECGKQFDPKDPQTYTRYPGFVLWKYWAPGFVLAALAGAIISYLFLLNNSVGWGLVLGVPISMGCLMGYGMRVRKRWMVILLLTAVMFVVGCVMLLNVAGPLCGFVLAGLFLIPASVGVGAGCILRNILKMTKFSQRWHLPVILILLIPIAVHAMERMADLKNAPEKVQTSINIPADIAKVWSAKIFDRGRARQKVGLMQVGLPPASNLRGEACAVGATKKLTFGKGELAICITDMMENHLLAWRFVGQSHVEDRAVRLLDSRMEFEALPTGGTRVSLSTRYQPLMTPRWYWRTAERISGEDAHRYILEELRKSAQEVH